MHSIRCVVCACRRKGRCLDIVKQWLLIILRIGRHRGRERRGLESYLRASIRNMANIEGRRLKGKALGVAFAMSLRLRAVVTYRPLLAALDTTPAASQASCLGPLPQQVGAEVAFCGRQAVVVPRLCADLVAGRWIDFGCHATCVPDVEDRSMSAEWIAHGRAARLAVRRGSRVTTTTCPSAGKTQRAAVSV